MARGWESKSIESQQEDAQAAKARKPALTPEERARAERRTSLQLALARAQSELQAACQPAYRDMLRMKLETLQQQLAELDGASERR
jgi:hypothetical protein